MPTMVTTPKSVSIRVSRSAYARARRLAVAQDLSLGQVIEQAIDDAERKMFFAQLRDSMDRLRADADAWAAYQAESRELEGTLMDGLDPNEDWSWLAEAERDGNLEFVDEAESGDATAR